MIGVKLYNQYKIWSPEVHPTIEKAIKERVPILEHTGCPTTPNHWKAQPNMSPASIRKPC